MARPASIINHPHDAAAERAVLACYLLSPELFDLHPTSQEHYHLVASRAIHAAFCHLRDEGMAFDLRTLSARLEEMGELGTVGGLAGLADLDGDLPDLSGISSYVAILEDRRLRRRLVQLAQHLDAGARNGHPAVDTLERHQHSLLRLVADSERSELLEADPHLAEFVERVVNLDPATSTSVPTYLPDIDRATHGFGPGQLWIVAGRPGHGKSALAQNIIREQAKHGIPACLFSLEMTGDEVWARLLAAETQIPASSIEEGHTSTGQRQQIRESARRLSALPLAISERGDSTLESICAIARALHARGRLRVLWIDHVSFVRVARGENRNLELERVFHALKALAKELRITVVVLNQLNRELERRSDGRPQLADLRDSGAAEQDADVVLLLLRPAYRDETRTEHLLQVDIAKQRRGPTGRIPLHFDLAHSLIRCYDHGSWPHDAND